jgi:chorismate mutase
VFFFSVTLRQEVSQLIEGLIFKVQNIKEDAVLKCLLAAPDLNVVFEAKQSQQLTECWENCETNRL